MTSIESCNCIICAGEFAKTELESIASFNICRICLNKCDPATDYKEAKDIVSSYLKLSEAKLNFDEARSILDSFKKL